MFLQRRRRAGRYPNGNGKQLFDLFSFQVSLNSNYFSGHLRTPALPNHQGVVLLYELALPLPEHFNGKFCFIDRSALMAPQCVSSAAAPLSPTEVGFHGSSNASK